MVYYLKGSLTRHLKYKCEFHESFKCDYCDQIMVKFNWKDHLEKIHPKIYKQLKSKKLKLKNCTGNYSANSLACFRDNKLDSQEVHLKSLKKVSLFTVSELNLHSIKFLVYALK